MDLEKIEQLNSDIEATFTKLEAGIRVYKWLEKICFKNKTTLVIGKPDESAYNEGHRDVLIEIDERIRRATSPSPKQVNVINKEK